MNEYKSYLISTGVKETWPKNKKSHLIFSSIAPLKKHPNKGFLYKGYDINKYHWDNKELLLKEFKYLENFYENLLKTLADFLNSIHKQNYSKNFWRILIGPWLGYTIFMFFDRWKNISSSVKKFKIDNVICLNINKNKILPYENADFFRRLTQNDMWNQYIYQSIYPEFLEKNKIKYLDLDDSILEEKLDTNYLTQKKGIRPQYKMNFFKKIIFNLPSFIGKKNYKYLIYRSYMGALNELKLSLKLNQFPILEINKDKYKSNKKKDDSLRRSLDTIFEAKNKFENFFVKSLKDHCPKVFIENFSDLVSFSNNSNLPEKPKVIFTANALWSDSFFMFHAARLKENKTKLIYGQHGGTYGIAQYSWLEEHEKKIADKYLTWGWSGTKTEKNVRRFYVLLKNNKYNWNKKKENLLVTMKHRRNYFQSPETSAAELFSDYIYYCTVFLNNISNSIKDKTILRFALKNAKLSQVDFYSQLENKFKFDNSKSFESACNSSRLIVNTTNSTTFCETLANNIPSISILNKKNHPLRENVKKYINLLEKNNIIFYESEKASKFVNKIWNNDVKNWWHNDNTQHAVREFQKNFANSSEDIVKQIINEIWQT